MVAFVFALAARCPAAVLSGLAVAVPALPRPCPPTPTPRAALACCPLVNVASSRLFPAAALVVRNEERNQIPLDI